MMRFRILIGMALAACVLLPARAQADALGDTRSFQVDTAYDADGSATMTATLRAAGQSAYVYVDDRYWASLAPSQQQQYSASLASLANAFDTVIYPRATAFWGSENTPGVDGDPHITILLERLISGNGGYFKTINSYPQSRASESNAREMIYISAESVLQDTAKNFITHEFQHLISFNQKELIQRIVDDVWLNEARSEYTITVVGYSDPFTGSTLQRRAQVFVQNPSDSLVDWPNTQADYANATLFGHYLADRFGSGVLASTIHSSNNGIVAINDWLSQNGQSERFPDIFTDWMVASYANDRALGPQYAYVRTGLDVMHVAPQYTASLGSDTQYVLGVGLQEWQPLWIRFDIVPHIQASTLTIRIGTSVGPWSGGAVVALYDNGFRSVTPFTAANGQGVVSIPFALPANAGAHIQSVMLAVTQGTQSATGDRPIPALPMSITASFGDAPIPVTILPPAGSPTSPEQPKDGDLIRHDAEQETYVVWGTYRRYLPAGVLALYGFQSRPVAQVSAETFTRYTTSNYVRAVDGTKVYALWPDGTKHWLDITPAQWDASGRDWNAIFIVNDAEVDFYETGLDITR